MPQKTSVRAKPKSRTSAKTASWGLVGLFACAIALAVTGCASTPTSSTIGAGTPVAATSDALLPTPAPTLDLSTPPPAAPATSAAASTAPAPPPPPATTAPPKTKPKPVTPTTHTAAPKPVTTTTKAKPSLCGAPSNPFGYNFCGRGGYIYSPAGSTCSYFHCIANFQNGKGYMVECKDATYSMSGGRSGVCSDHGGKLQAVYSG